MLSKHAGILKVPPKLEKEVVGWALSVYCKKILETIIKAEYNIHQFRVYSDVMAEMMKKAKVECWRYIRSEYKNPQDFHISAKEFRQMGYLKPNESALLKDIVFGCMFLFSNDPKDEEIAKEITDDEVGDFKGLFDGDLYLKKAILEPTRLYTLPEELKDIASTARHELQHLVQKELKKVKVLPKSTGLPGRKQQQSSYNEHGEWIGKIPQQNNLTQQIPDERPTLPSLQQERLPHELRDIEFYTNLTDQIDEFKQVARKLPPQIHHQLLDVFMARIPVASFFQTAEFLLAQKNPRYSNKSFRDIAPLLHNKIMNANNYFNILKTNPGKYRKAVIEMYKAVSNLL